MESNTSRIKVNLKKAHSLITRITDMVAGGEDTTKIMQQNLAVMGLLKSAHMMILESHLDDCFSGNITKSQKKMIAEILRVGKISKKLMKS